MYKAITVPGTALSIYHINPLNPYNSPVRSVSLAPHFTSWENKTSEKWSNLPKVTQQVTELVFTPWAPEPVPLAVRIMRLSLGSLQNPVPFPWDTVLYVYLMCHIVS